MRSMCRNDIERRLGFAAAWRGAPEPQYYAGLSKLGANDRKRVIGTEFRKLFPDAQAGWSYDFNKLQPIKDDRLYWVGFVSGTPREITRFVMYTPTNKPTTCGAKCRNAAGPACDCSCKGENHGKNKGTT